MGLVRTLSGHPTVHYVQAYKKSFGRRARDFLSWARMYFNPVIQILFPNFIICHYFYIISMALVASILIYPVRNIPYIDALFLSTGAATQGGLNTVDLNSLVLYQQIVIYIVCFISSPIWVHGGLVFVRLFWFERYFDGIQEWSKKNFQMRRTKTLLERELNRKNTLTGSSRRGSRSKAGPNRWRNDRSNYNNMESVTTDSGYRKGDILSNSGAFHGGVTSLSRDCVSDFQVKLFTGKMINREEHESDNEEQDSSSLKKSQSLDSDSVSDLAEGAQAQATRQRRLQKEPSKEGFLSRRGSGDVNPTDMYRSLAMMQQRNKGQIVDEQGPALVVKGPHDRDSTSSEDNIGSEDVKKTNYQRSKDANRTGITQTFPNQNPNMGPSIQFDIDNLPKPSSIKKAFQNHHHYHHPSDSHTAGPISMSSSLTSNHTNGTTSTKPKKKAGLFRKFSASSILPERVFGSSASSHLEEDGNDADLEDTENDDYDYDDDEDGENDSSALESTSPSFDDITNDVGFNIDDSGSNQKNTSPKSNGTGTITKVGISTDKKCQAQAKRSNSFNKISHDNQLQGRTIRTKRTASADTMVSHADTINSIDSCSQYYDEEDGGIDLSQSNFSRTMSTNYLSYAPTIGRNSIFIGLNDAQKIELGGVEYRATRLLCKILVIYYFGFHMCSVILLLPWIHSKTKYETVLREDGISPTWWTFFSSLSSFNDLGLTLTPNSMMSFSKEAYPLLVMIWFIIIGNTGFPILLRFLIWFMFKLSPDLSLMKENLGFLLDHPRRCFTLLFPSAATWCLFLILILLNGLDLILFVIHGLNSKLLDGLSPGYKVLDGLFQAVNTRAAGFSVVDVSQLHPSIQVSYVLMMYISVMPVAISIRRTNVYEEQSLGVYGNMMPILANDFDNTNGNEPVSSRTGPDTSASKNNYRNTTASMHHRTDTDRSENPREQKTISFVGAHLRKQLSHDLWYMFLGLFFICIAEGDKIQDPALPSFNIWQILFEVVSAYGTVGLSLGFPNTNQSFSAQFSPFSKFVIICMLIRGRHRGLPYSLDRAIMLPSDKLKRIDQLEDLKLHSTITSNKDPLLEYWKKRTKSVSTGIANAIQRTRSHLSQQSRTSHRYQDRNDDDHVNESYQLNTNPNVSNMSDLASNTRAGDSNMATTRLRRSSTCASPCQLVESRPKAPI